MEIKEKVLDTNLEVVTLDQVQIGDIITISPYQGATRYTVLDKGTPFILIENIKSRFASLYRPETLYKPINK